jgi:hypothetical protein
MQLLDEIDQRWYCFKDDLLYSALEGKWSDEPPSSEAEKNEYYYRKEHAYEAIYVDGYQDCQTSSAKITILSDGILLQITNRNDQPREVASIKIPYPSLEVVNVTEEREITALRTFIAGPLLAALFKKENKFLNLGFRDENGLLQNPCFKIARGEIWNCYELILKRLRRRKGLPEIGVLY